MVKIYGIKNCDTMQKAMKWLDGAGINYEFHNYKTDGIDKATVQTWLKHFPSDKLINTKGTTFRGLSEDEKVSISNKTKAVALMLAHTSIIKRPIWDFGDGRIFLGWDEAAIKQSLGM